MNRTTVLNATGRKCDNEKVTESALCDDIHDNLRVLAFINPFTDEMKAVFEKGMFVRSNPKAFPHVMRYLFLFIDAVEFRKKFGWPLYNKAAEATFRNATLEFLEKINAKYNLGFGILKNHIVVFPGGHDFMKILLELTKLAMRLVLKRFNQSVNAPLITVAEAQEQLTKVQHLHHISEIYCKKLEDHSNELKAKTKILKSLIDDLTNKTSISSEMILNGAFETHCQKTHEATVENSIKPDLQLVKSFQEKCTELEASIAKVFQKRTIEYKEEEIDRFLNFMRKTYPQHSFTFDKVIVNHQINVDNLFFTFELAIPLLLNHIATFQPPNMDILKYEATGLDKLVTKASTIFNRLMMFDKQMALTMQEEEEKMTENGDGSLSATTSHLKTLFLATPPISYNALHRSRQLTICPKRISLMEDHGIGRNPGPSTGSKLSAISENLILTTPVSSKASAKNVNTTMSPVRTSSKLDPLAMLRTIEKKNKKSRQPLNANKRFLSSSLTQLKWQEQKTDETFNELKSNLQPEFSSTLILATPSIPTDTLQLSYTSPAPDLSATVEDTKTAFRKHRAVMQHLEYEERDKGPRDVHKSPSGRMDALYSSECDKKNLIKFKSYASRAQAIDKIEQIAPALPSLLEPSIQNIENNPNISNVNVVQSVMKPSLFQIINSEDESLLNISDSVLNSIQD